MVQGLDNPVNPTLLMHPQQDTLWNVVERCFHTTKHMKVGCENVHASLNTVMLLLNQHSALLPPVQKTNRKHSYANITVVRTVSVGVQVYT